MERKKYWILAKCQGRVLREIESLDEGEAWTRREALTQSGYEIILFASEDDYPDVADIIGRSGLHTREEDRRPFMIDAPRPNDSGP